MKKNLLTFSSLLLLSPSFLNSMNKQEKKQNNEFLTKLMEHPVLLKLKQQDNQTTNAQSSPEDKPEQKEINLAISQLISGTIAITDNEPTANQGTLTALKTGFNWTLRWKALTSSTPDLAHYALEQNLFEPDNADHHKLLNQGILECVSTQNNEKLTTLITLAKEKHAGTITLSDEASAAAHQQLTHAHKTQIATLASSFEQSNNNKVAQMITILQKLEEFYNNALTETTKLNNAFNSEYTETKAEFLACKNHNKKITNALKKLSNGVMTAQEQSASWNELVKNTPSTQKNINSTITALNQHKEVIKYAALEK